MKNFGFAIFGVVLFTASANSTIADTDTHKQYLTVRVSVNADDEIKSQVESYINRELRSLQDVLIVDSDAMWALDIVAMQTSTIGGYKNGIILSVVVLSIFDRNRSAPFHALYTGSAENLQNRCSKLVAEFDNRELENVRKGYATGLELQKELFGDK